MPWYGLGLSGWNPGINPLLTLEHRGAVERPPLFHIDNVSTWM